MLLMIPIEELKLEIQHSCLSAVLFWWYLLRNWNLIVLVAQRIDIAFDDTYWGIETPLWLSIVPRSTSFDDTYWGIETMRMILHWLAMQSFDDTYWGIETILGWLYGRIARLLMIPIEELKPGRSVRTLRNPQLLMIPIEELKHMTLFPHRGQDMVLLMIPIEELKPVHSANISTQRAAFWWYLLRNWNSPLLYGFVLSGCFWWYLLRNWNSVRFPTCPANWLLMIPIEELKRIHVSPSTSVGSTLLMIPIEELKLRKKPQIHNPTLILLMIPIEELKPARAEGRSAALPFDDTYWGIETFRRLRNL